MRAFYITWKKNKKVFFSVIKSSESINKNELYENFEIKLELGNFI